MKSFVDNIVHIFQILCIHVLKRYETALNEWSKIVLLLLRYYLTNKIIINYQIIFRSDISRSLHVPYLVYD